MLAQGYLLGLIRAHLLFLVRGHILGMKHALQSEVARLLSANRTQDSYFAGGAMLNLETWRQSDDLDIFT